MERQGLAKRCGGFAKPSTRILAQFMIIIQRKDDAEPRQVQGLVKLGLLGSDSHQALPNQGY